MVYSSLSYRGSEKKCNNPKTILLCTYIRRKIAKSTNCTNMNSFTVLGEKTFHKNGYVSLYEKTWVLCVFLNIINLWYEYVQYATAWRSWDIFCRLHLRDLIGRELRLQLKKYTFVFACKLALERNAYCKIVDISNF